jgi:hypothetical protein|tara:strand:+ start:165 stop:749 length:585 start_codon:yes stop_codon:yes gene_type:complete
LGKIFFQKKIALKKQLRYLNLMQYTKESIKSALQEYFEDLEKTLDGLDKHELNWKPNIESNNIIFLVWHMSLVEDNLINKVLGRNERIWISQKYFTKYPFLKYETGFGFNLLQLNDFPIMDIEWLMAYFRKVRNSTNKMINSLTNEDLNNDFEFGSKKVIKVKGFWILGRLIVEESQHLGQIAYIRGIIKGLNQ